MSNFTVIECWQNKSNDLRNTYCMKRANLMSQFSQRVKCNRCCLFNWHEWLLQSRTDVDLSWEPPQCTTGKITDYSLASNYAAYCDPRPQWQLTVWPLPILTTPPNQISFSGLLPAMKKVNEWISSTTDACGFKVYLVECIKYWL